MNQTLNRIIEFIDKHHLLTLSTSYENQPQSCSAFYVFDEKSVSFVIASDYDTQHIKNVLLNPKIAVVVALETEDIGKIQGIQCKGEMAEVKEGELKKKYFEKYPYARVMHPTLWSISIHQIKFTNNRLGFGKKLIWKRETLD